MKKYILLLIIPFLTFGQENYLDKEKWFFKKLNDTRSFSSNIEAESVLGYILDAGNIKQDFLILDDPKTSTAQALVFEEIKVILYNPEFMKSISKNTSDWSKVFILAHEVGHHHKGHFRGQKKTTLLENRKQELEADEFAGFILSRLGVPLKETIGALSQLPKNEPDTYSTHPSRSKRIAAAKKGWSKYKKAITNSTEESFNTHFYKGLEEFRKYIYKGNNTEVLILAIEYFTNCLELKPNHALSYFYRGSSYLDVANGAVVNIKGQSNYSRALNDLNKSLSFNKNYSYSYYNRGIAKIMLGYDNYDWCADWKKACNMGVGCDNIPWDVCGKN